jgi:two-component system LytT family response regulator
MLRVVVVDDEPLARQGMRQLLAKHSSVQLVGEAGSVKAAADLIQREQPDAVFLDIEMHGDTGFDLLQQLTEPPDIVFVTAHSQHAVKAYDVAATDYLLKPVNPKRLATALAKLAKTRQIRREADQSRQQDGIPVLRLKARGTTVIVRVDSIVAIRAEGDYAFVLAEKMPPVLAGQSLGQLEATMPKPPFIRISRSLVINMVRVREIETVDRDTTRLWLTGWTESFLLGRAASAKLKKATSIPGA